MDEIAGPAQRPRMKVRSSTHEHTHTHTCTHMHTHTCIRTHMHTFGYMFSHSLTQVCYICGREYGSASLPIHIPSCIERFERENEALPPSVASCVCVSVNVFRRISLCLS
jgi:hypothetical protein